MDEQIIDLGGNILKPKSQYRLVIDLPFFNDRAKYTYTANRITGEAFTLIVIGKKWYSLTWVSHLDLYLLKELEFIRYEEVFDIKYEWKHRKELKKRLGDLKKNAKT